MDRRRGEPSVPSKRRECFWRRSRTGGGSPFACQQEVHDPGPARQVSGSGRPVRVPQFVSEERELVYEHLRPTKAYPLPRQGTARVPKYRTRHLIEMAGVPVRRDVDRIITNTNLDVITVLVENNTWWMHSQETARHHAAVWDAARTHRHGLPKASRVTLPWQVDLIAEPGGTFHETGKADPSVDVVRNREFGVPMLVVKIGRAEWHVFDQMALDAVADTFEQAEIAAEQSLTAEFYSPKSRPPFIPPPIERGLV
jgi:hypothetical protein